MTADEIKNEMFRQAGFGSFNQPQVEVPLEKVKEFVQRCIAEKDYTEYTLLQECKWKLYGQPQAPNYVMISNAEQAILPLVVEYLEGEIK